MAGRQVGSFGAGRRFRRAVVALLTLALVSGMLASEARAGSTASNGAKAPLQCDGATVTMHVAKQDDSNIHPPFPNWYAWYNAPAYLRVVVPPGGSVNLAGGFGHQDRGVPTIGVDVVGTPGATPLDDGIIASIAKFGVPGTSNGAASWRIGTTAGEGETALSITPQPYVNTGPTPAVVILRVFAGDWLGWDDIYGDYTLTFSVLSGTGAGAWCAIYTQAALNEMLGDSDLPGQAADPVNTATGNFVDTHEDLGAPAGAYGLGWSRTYNSMDGYAEGYTYAGQPRVLSPKWTTPVDVHLKPLDVVSAGAANPGQTLGLEWLGEDGRRVVFAPLTTGANPTWAVPANEFASVAWNNTTRVFTVKKASGEVLTFDDLGRLSTKSDGAAQTVRVCRDGAGKPQNLRTDNGLGTACTVTPTYQLTFADGNGDGLLDRVTRSDGTFVDYQYNKGRLRAVSYPRTASETVPPFLQAEGGTGTAGSSGDNGPASSAAFSSPKGLAYDSKGNLYVADTGSHKVRRIDTAGVVTTVAGTGTAGAPILPAVGSQASGPTAVVADAAGNLYYADKGNFRVRKVNAAGNVSTIAGTGSSGFGGDGGAATAATLSDVYALALDASGNVYIGDYNNCRVRKITVATGVISTFAGTGGCAATGDGGLATAAEVGNVTGLAVDSGGQLFIADYWSGRIRRVGTDGKIYAVAGALDGTRAFADGTGSAARFSGAPRLAAAGTDIYVADPFNNRIRKVTSANVVTTVAGGGSTFGDGGQALAAQLASPSWVAIRNGELLIADTDAQRVRKVNTSGVITTVAGTGGYDFSPDGTIATAGGVKKPQGVAFGPAGEIILSDTDSHRVRFIDGAGKLQTKAGSPDGAIGNADAVVAATASPLSSPSGVALDAKDQLYIADTGNHLIRRVDTKGNIVTVAGVGSTGFSGDGVSATSAQLASPGGLAVSGGPTPTVYVADTNNHRIRSFTVGGSISTIAGTGTAGAAGDGASASAAQLNGPTGVAVDGGSPANVYVADRLNHKVRKFAVGGNMSTLAGTGVAGFSGDGAAATAAKLNAPAGIALSGTTVVVADTANHRVRTLPAAGGNIATAIGTGTPAYNGDNDAATTRNINTPYAVTTEDSGAIHVADTANHRIRYVATIAGYRYFTTADDVRGVTRIEHTTRTGRAPQADIVNVYDGYPTGDADTNHIQGRVVAQDQPTGDHVSFVYDFFTSAAPFTQTTHITWCSKWTGSACDTSVPNGGTQEVTHYKHSQDGRLIEMTDAWGRPTTNAWDRDRTQSSTDRTGAQTGAAFDDQGRVIQVAKPDPVSGFVPQVGGASCPRNNDAYKTFPTPGSAGCTGPNQAFTLEKYDYCTPATGGAYDPRITKATDALGNVTRFLYGSTDINNPCTASLDSQSTPTRTIDGLGKISNTVTAKVGGKDTGLVTQVTDADGVVTTTAWDTAKRLKLSEGVAGNTTYYGYDGMGRQIVVRTPLGEETWTTFDGGGRVLDVVGPALPVTVRTCVPATGCNFPTAIEANFDGPTIHSVYRLDGSLAARVQRQNKAGTGSVRQTDYDSNWKNGAAVCVPPASGCEQEDTVTGPAFGYDPAAPTATMRTTATTRYDSSGKVKWSKITDSVTASSYTSTTNYRTDPANPSTNLRLGRVASTVSPSGLAKTVGYDGNVTASGNGSTSGKGDVTSTGLGTPAIVQATRAYDKRGRVIEERGPSGVTDETGAAVQSCTHYTYDALDRVSITSTGAATGVLGVAPDCVDSTSGSTKLLHAKSVYDAGGRKTHTIVDLDNDGVYTDVSCGSAADPQDVVNQETYTDAGRRKETIAPPVDVDRTTGFDWCTGTGKRVTTSSYDTAGRLSQITPPAGTAQAPTKYLYDADNHLTQQQVVSGTTVYTYKKFGYDVQGRVVTTSVPAPALDGTDATEVTCYNKFGDKTYQSESHTGVNLTTPCDLSTGLGSDSATYGQYQSFDYYDNGAMKSAYSALRKSLGANADLARTDLFYDSRGNRTARTSWTCASTTACSNPATRDATHWHQVTEKWTFDADGQVSTYLDPIQAAAATPKAASFTYYANTEVAAGQVPGKLKTITLPSGRTVTATYRTDGQLAGQTFADPAAPGTDVVLGFSYNAQGLRTKMTDKTGAAAAIATTFTYDRLGMVMSQTSPNRTATGPTTFTTSYTRDLAGLVRQVTYGDGVVFLYTHDASNRLKDTYVSAFGGWWPKGTATYTAFGPIASETNLGGSSAQSRAWSYGTAGAIQDTKPHLFTETITDTPSNISISTSLNYRSQDGRLGQETTGGVTWTYTYDDAGQLTGRTGGTTSYAYTYNARGERLTQTAGTVTTSSVYDDNAQLLSSTPSTGSATAYAWDLDGRQTIADTGAGASKLTTTYDPRGMVKTVVTTASGTTTNTEARTYDAAARLVRTTYGSTGYDFIWDVASGVPQVLEARKGDLAGAGAVWQRSYQGSHRIGYDDTLGSGVVMYAYDAHDNIVQTSKVPAPASYDPFGAGQGGNPAYVGWGYRGELTINGVVHLRARDYSPTTGLMRSRDPMGGVLATPTTTNPFHYGVNDPINTADPLGLTPTDADQPGGDDDSDDPIDAYDMGFDDFVDSLGIHSAEELSKALGDVFAGMWESIMGMVGGLVQFAEIAACASPLGGLGSLLIGSVREFCEEKFSQISDMIGAAQENPLEFLKTLGKGIVHWDQCAQGGAYKCIGSFIPDIVICVLTSCVESMVSAVKGGFQAVKDVLQGIKNISVEDSIEAVKGIVVGCITKPMSFGPDTLVLMANGDRKRIADITIGDFVVAVDPQTGERGARAVVGTTPHSDQLLLFRTSSGDILTTEDHRYWNDSDGRWEESKEIDPGDRLLSADGDVVTVEGLDWSTVQTGPAYDLTVDDLHSFFVAAGPEEVLVHNCGISDALSESKFFNRGQRAFTLEQGTAKAGWKHIFDRHIDRARFTGKTKFASKFTEDDVVELLHSTLKHGKESNYDGNMVFEFRTNFKGSGYKTYRATVLPDGRVQTFHPLGASMP